MKCLPGVCGLLKDGMSEIDANARGKLLKRLFFEGKLILSITYRALFINLTGYLRLKELKEAIVRK